MQEPPQPSVPHDLPPHFGVQQVWVFGLQTLPPAHGFVSAQLPGDTALQVLDAVSQAVPLAQAHRDPQPSEPHCLPSQACLVQHSPRAWMQTSPDFEQSLSTLQELPGVASQASVVGLHCWPGRHWLGQVPPQPSGPPHLPVQDAMQAHLPAAEHVWPAAQLPEQSMVALQPSERALPHRPG